MAKISFKGMEAFGEKLWKWEAENKDGKIIKRAVVAGAAPVADAIRDGMNALPEDKFRYLRGDDAFSVLTEEEKAELNGHFGLAPIEKDETGFVNTKAGFEGYTDRKTKNYPEGIPVPMIVASIESGSSVRKKRPFIRPAVRKTRNESIKKMADVIDEETKKIFEGG